MTASSHDVTALLHAWTAGDRAARDQLMTVVYQELRNRAAGQLRREREGTRCSRRRSAQRVR